MPPAFPMDSCHVDWSHFKARNIYKCLQIRLKGEKLIQEETKSLLQQRYNLEHPEHATHAQPSEIMLMSCHIYIPMVIVLFINFIRQNKLIAFMQQLAGTPQGALTAVNAGLRLKPLQCLFLNAPAWGSGSIPLTAVQQNQFSCILHKGDSSWRCSPGCYHPHMCFHPVLKLVSKA